MNLPCSLPEAVVRYPAVDRIVTKSLSELMAQDHGAANHGVTNHRADDGNRGLLSLGFGQRTLRSCLIAFLGLMGASVLGCDSTGLETEKPATETPATETRVTPADIAAMSAGADGSGLATGSEVATGPAIVSDDSVISGLPSDAEAFPKLNLSQDWPWWRGPFRSGHAPSDAQSPVRLDPDSAKWTALIPGRGHCSPIVVGNHVFVMTAVESNQEHWALAFDRDSGRELWRTLLNQGGFPARNHPKNTEASPTLASDGEHVYAAIFHHEKVELIALDFAGQVVWRADAGRFNPQLYEYGYAPSPVLYKDMVIISAEYDGPSSLQAFRRQDGKPVWKAERPTNITFSSPIIAHLGQRDVLMLSGGRQLAAYDPATGAALWDAPAAATATCGTAVWDGQRAFVSGGYPQNETTAIDLTQNPPQVAWRVNQKCYEQSMIVIGDYLYALTDQGILFCWRASDGEEMWKQRLRGPVSASGVFANGHLYWANEAGTLYVIRPNPNACDVVSENRVGDDAFPTIAVSGRQVFVRAATGRGAGRQERLMCFE